MVIGLAQEGRVTKKPKETPHLRLRIGPELLARLEKSREKTGRTLTGEIVARLQSSFRREDNEALIVETIDKTIEALRAAMPEPTPEQQAMSRAENARIRGILGDLGLPKRPTPDEQKD